MKDRSIFKPFLSAYSEEEDIDKKIEMLEAFYLQQEDNPNVNIVEVTKDLCRWFRFTTFDKREIKAVLNLAYTFKYYDSWFQKACDKLEHIYNYLYAEKYRKNKRTSIDFSEHELIIQENDLVTIHQLKKPDTIVHNVRFVNFDYTMAIDGDFGRWIACRNFYPNTRGDSFVSDGYWLEKLSISTHQNVTEYNDDRTQAGITQIIDTLQAEIQELEEEKSDLKLEVQADDDIFGDNKYRIDEIEKDVDDLNELIDAWKEARESVYDDVEYTTKVRKIVDNHNIDWDDIPFYKKTVRQLEYIFDAFEEICRRVQIQAINAIKLD